MVMTCDLQIVITMGFFCHLSSSEEWFLIVCFVLLVAVMKASMEGESINALRLGSCLLTCGLGIFKDFSLLDLEFEKRKPDST